MGPSRSESQNAPAIVLGASIIAFENLTKFHRSAYRLPGTSHCQIHRRFFRATSDVNAHLQPKLSRNSIAKPYTPGRNGLSAF